MVPAVAASEKKRAKFLFVCYLVFCLFQGFGFGFVLPFVVVFFDGCFWLALLVLAGCFGFFCLLKILVYCKFFLKFSNAINYNMV